MIRVTFARVKPYKVGRLINAIEAADHERALDA